MRSWKKETGLETGHYSIIQHIKHFCFWLAKNLCENDGNKSYATCFQNICQYKRIFTVTKANSIDSDSIFTVKVSELNWLGFWQLRPFVLALVYAIYAFFHELIYGCHPLAYHHRCKTRLNNLSGHLVTAFQKFHAQATSCTLQNEHTYCILYDYYLCLKSTTEEVHDEPKIETWAMIELWKLLSLK